ncbi:MAG: DUF3592 domain-containing protein [Microlunatus sp.]
MNAPSEDQWPRMPGQPSDADPGPEPIDPESADQEPGDRESGDPEQTYSTVTFSHHTVSYTRTTNRSTRVIGWIFVAVGVVSLLAMGIPALALATKPARTGWSASQATVVDVRVEGSGADQLYTATVEYPTRSGLQRCELQATSRATFPKGLGLPVRYNRDQPSLCRYSPGDAPGWVAWMLGGMGAGFLLIFGGIGAGVLRSRGARA